jgi:RNA polymerase sigma-70 factor (ECF subfamily)
MSLSMPAVNSVYIEYSATKMSDEMLASRAKSGDPDAFVELSKRHANRVFQATYRVTRNRQDAEDALQDAFLNAFTHMKGFEGRSSFSTWLTRIAINSALMILRKKRNCYEIPIDGGDRPAGNFATWEPPCPIDDPERQYVRAERHKLLRKAIHQLPPVYREVIQLRQAKERSVREISQSLGITVSGGQVKNVACKERPAHIYGSNRLPIVEKRPRGHLIFTVEVLKPSFCKTFGHTTQIGATCTKVSTDTFVQ